MKNSIKIIVLSGLLMGALSSLQQPLQAAPEDVGTIYSMLTLTQTSETVPLETHIQAVKEKLRNAMVGLNRDQINKAIRSIRMKTQTLQQPVTEDDAVKILQSPN